MKHIYIHCAFLADADYRTVLERLCPDSVRNITVYTHFPARITCKQIASFVNVQKAFRQDQAVRFKNHGVFEEPPRLSKALLKTLRKNNIFLELQVQKEQAPKLVRVARRLEKAGVNYRFCINEMQDQQGVYALFSKHGLHIHFTDPQYTSETPDLFDKWLYDPAAQGVNTFTDIINMLVMQTHSPNCRHASCFGNTFFVDDALNVYLCPFHKDAHTKLGSLREVNNLESLLNCEAVAQLLPVAVRKRQHCSTTCQGFPYCQGGCPLSDETGIGCEAYTSTVERIRQRLLAIYQDGKVGQVNYIVKNAILNALAFGTAFFNQRQE